MAIEAQLFDGTIVEFPDDTDRSVIEKTVKKFSSKKIYHALSGYSDLISELPRTFLKFGSWSH